MANESDRPPFGTLFLEDVSGFLLERGEAGMPFALITLVGIEGSSPRPLGAQMGVASDGSSAGYLSGGCLERAVIAEALRILSEGTNRQIRYGKGSKYVDISLPCGSAIDLYFDVGVELATIRDIRRAALERRPIATLTDVSGYGSAVIARDDGPTRAAGGAFWKHFKPPLRLLLAGTGPNVLYLARLAWDAGIGIRLFSPDDATLALAHPYVEEATHLKTPANVPSLVADSRSAIVTLFHDHDWEPRILESALASDAFYIGSVGSNRTHAVRLQTLQRMGFPAESLARIWAPAGLSRRSRTAPEIAASILAQILDEARAAV